MGARSIMALGLLFMLLIHTGAEAGQALEPEHVLLLNSYNPRMTWVKDIGRAVEDVLDPDNNNIVLHIANMDAKQFHSVAYFDAYGDFLKEKYKNSRFSLILSSDNHAFDFLRKYRDRIFPGVPVSFCGVNNFKDEQIREHDKFTGVAEIFSARNTVELALNLHPDTREIFILNDYLETGRAWERDIATALDDFKDKVKLTYNDNLSMNELLAKIAGLKKKTIVLLGAFYADKEGKYFTYEKVGAMLSGASNVPVYCLLEFNMGKGVVGGEVISGYFQGQAMARIGKRLLFGEEANRIPVLKKGANRIIFDYQQLKKFSLKESSLPQESVVINKPFSLFTAYKKELFTILIMMTILVVVIVALVLNIFRRTRAEKALRESEERFRQLADAAWEGIIIHDQGVVLRANNMFLKMFDLGYKDILGKNIIDKVIAPESLDFVKSKIISGEMDPYEATGIKKNGTTFPMEIRLRMIDFQGQKIRVAALRDLTEQKQMEERLTQSQKMEAMGTLAGGIAHDFNNILSAVIGYAELGTLKTEPGSKIHSYLEKILAAGKRARELVQQILAFSRQSKTVKQPVNLGSITKETLKMLRASLPTTVEIQIQINSDANVMADPVHLHQIIMNLCTNAALAMRESGGILDIALNEVELAQTFIAISPDLVPGRYIHLVVGDTGCGMSEAVQSRIFEPFFTTREQGEGTGMGLSVVHGIVTGMSGAINVYSEPGQGSSFNIYLPVIQDGAGAPVEKEQAPVRGGSEHILFVDDEPFQVDLGKNILGHLGYQVTATTSSEEAFEMFKADPNGFDLLITDVTMPMMTGDVLAKKILNIRPGFPIIICTGYSERLSHKRIKDIGVKGFTMKPMLLNEIAQKIRHSLGDNPR